MVEEDIDTKLLKNNFLYLYKMETVPVTIICNDKLFTFNQPIKGRCKYIAKSIELKDGDHVIYTHTYNNHVSIKHYYSQTDFNKYKELFEGMENA